jgi:hypothetical protein
MDDPLKFVTYCGLYCGLCAARTRIPRQAAALQQSMGDEGWPFWGPTMPDFTEFWRFLGELADEGCPGCRAGGGYPQCQIRVCTRERGLEMCSQCPDFPCERVEPLAARYPTLLADNRRLQAVGLARWLAEQEERARRSVVYADTRYRPEEAE